MVAVPLISTRVFALAPRTQLHGQLRLQEVADEGLCGDDGSNISVSYCNFGINIFDGDLLALTCIYWYVLTYELHLR